MSTRALRIVGATLFLFAAVAMPQTAVPPPPKPAGAPSPTRSAPKRKAAVSGPSLKVTMQFIQDKLSDIGKVTLVASFQNTSNGGATSNTFTDEVSNVHPVSGAGDANGNQCYVFYHWKSTRDGSTLQDMDYLVPLRDVEDIVVKPFEQYLNDIDAASGSPNLVVSSMNPPLTALLVRRPHNIMIPFPFSDASLADRVAKAFTHAVELCGGGNKDPF
jgi:hypothetical protein